MSHEPHVPNRFEDELRAYGLGFPGATEDFPWGHRALKVGGKTFAWLISDATGLGVSVKLPESNAAAIMMPFAQPSGYGLAKAGWVQCQFRQDETPPVELLKKWMDESYRAVAPKKLVKQLIAGDAGGTSQVAHASAATMKSTPPGVRVSAASEEATTASARDGRSSGRAAPKRHGDKPGQATGSAAARALPKTSPSKSSRKSHGDKLSRASGSAAARALPKASASKSSRKSHVNKLSKASGSAAARALPKTSPLKSSRKSHGDKLGKASGSAAGHSKRGVATRLKAAVKKLRRKH